MSDTVGEQLGTCDNFPQFGAHVKFPGCKNWRPLVSVGEQVSQPRNVLAEIMEMAPMRHILGLNHRYESGCTCLRCEADNEIEKQAEDSHALIKRMVDRFLGWKLPENFNPDGGISFKKAINENRPSWPQKNEPTGTNLFDAKQAEEMVRYMLAGVEESHTPQALHFEIIKYNAMCWKVYLGNSFLGSHNTELQAANFVRNLEINIRKFRAGARVETPDTEGR